MPDSTVDIPSSNDIEDNLRCHTSANFLCNFMTKPEYLIECLKDMALKPRYVEERIDYLHIDGFSRLVFPMTCFCDIPLSKIKEHTDTYDSYGIALNKARCIKKNVQPIIYLNEASDLTRDLKEALASLTNTRDQVDERWSFLPDMLLSVLLYAKPMRGSMWRRDGGMRDKLFIDECEWRYIPTMPESMPLVLPLQDNTESGRSGYSKALSRHNGTWFTFELADVDYIIVPDERGAMEIIRSIDSMDDRDEETKHRLMSKIEIADKFDLNFV